MAKIGREFKRVHYLNGRVNTVADRIHAVCETSDSRLLVALAGAPGSGKSTLATEVARRLTDQKCPTVIVSMDGFHLDNSLLDQRGLRARKGAPETFDAEGFANAITRIKKGEAVILPKFDRSQDIAIAGAEPVPTDCSVILVEGNYLMFDQPPWAGLATLWDLSIWLEVSEADVRSRLIQRWLSHGLSRTAATRRVETNDMVNARQVIDKLLLCDLVLD